MSDEPQPEILYTISNDLPMCDGVSCKYYKYVVGPYHSRVCALEEVNTPTSLKSICRPAVREMAEKLKSCQKIVADFRKDNEVRMACIDAIINSEIKDGPISAGVVC